MVRTELASGKIFIAQNSNQTVGTASIKKIRPDTAEIKRMYVNQNIKETE